MESYVEVYLSVFFYYQQTHWATLIDCCLVKMCATAGTLCIRCTFRLIISFLSLVNVSELRKCHFSALLTTKLTWWQLYPLFESVQHALPRHSSFHEVFLNGAGPFPTIFLDNFCKYRHKSYFISFKLNPLGYIFCRRHYRSIFNHFNVNGSQSYRIRWNNADYRAINLRRSKSLKVTSFGASYRSIWTSY